MSDEHEDRVEHVTVDAEGYKKYVFKYRFKDEEWAFTMPAQDAEEAQERVHCLALYGRLEGEEVFSFRAPRGFGWLAMIIVRVRNWFVG